jgi:hypothetical protein
MPELLPPAPQRAFIYPRWRVNEAAALKYMGYDTFDLGSYVMLERK